MFGVVPLHLLRSEICAPTPHAAISTPLLALTHPADSVHPNPASASHAYRSGSSPRPRAPAAPAPFECRSPLPADAWRNCALRCSSSPVFPDKPAARPVSQLVAHCPPANDGGAACRLLDRAPECALEIARTRPTPPVPEDTFAPTPPAATPRKPP